MTLPAFTYSGVSYALPAAGTTEFNLITSGGKAIDFLDVSHIHVYATTDGGITLSELSRPTGWDFNTSRTKVVLASGVDGSTSIVIRRITPAGEPYSLIGAGTLLSSDQLNSETRFNLFVNQETLESVEESIQQAQDAIAAAQEALSIISEAIGYDLVSNVAAIPAAPTDGSLVEVFNSTGIESFTPLTGVPFGFVGESGLSVRIRYDEADATWTWISYYANDTDDRYVKLTALSSSTSSTSESNVATSLAVKTAKDVADAAMPISGGAFTGPVTSSSSISDLAGNLRDIPQNAKTASYTLVASDVGKHISITTGGVTVPSGAFSVGDAVSIYNNSSSSQTITQGSGVTLRRGGTDGTGNRTLAQRGLATILCVASNEFVITGAGLS